MLQCFAFSKNCIYESFATKVLFPPLQAAFSNVLMFKGIIDISKQNKIISIKVFVKMSFSKLNNRCGVTVLLYFYVFRAPDMSCTDTLGTGRCCWVPTV